MRLELIRHYWHHPLKMACLPISPILHRFYLHSYYIINYEGCQLFFLLKKLFLLAFRVGLEPTTYGLEDRCSIPTELTEHIYFCMGVLLYPLYPNAPP